MAATQSRRGGKAKTDPQPAPADTVTDPAVEPADVGEQAAEQEQATTAGQRENTAEHGAEDNVAHDGEQAPETVEPETERTDGGNAAGDGETAVHRAAAATADTLQVAGDPEPAQVQASMVRDETGLSPEVETHDVAPTAATGDNPRNGKAAGIPTDTSGELRHIDGAVPTAAYGQAANNGHVTGMDREGQVGTDFGGNGDSPARLVGDGVRGEQGVGTANPDIGPDERPQYPSTTLTRSSSSAAPMEPEDVKYATQPKLGDVQGSLDPTMAAAQMPSMAGDATLDLVDGNGKSVKPSEVFQVPEGITARTFRRVSCRVSEVYTVRKAATPSQRLLFTEGQLIPVDIAETLIRLHG